MPNIIRLFLDPTRLHFLHSYFLLFYLQTKSKVSYAHCELLTWWCFWKVRAMAYYSWYLLWPINLMSFYMLCYHAAFIYTGLFPMETGESRQRILPEQKCKSTCSVRPQESLWFKCSITRTFSRHDLMMCNHGTQRNQAASLSCPPPTALL